MPIKKNGAHGIRRKEMENRKGSQHEVVLITLENIKQDFAGHMTRRKKTEYMVAKEMINAKRKRQGSIEKMREGIV